MESVYNVIWSVKCCDKDVAAALSVREVEACGQQLPAAFEFRTLVASFNGFESTLVIPDA
jgi:hypothetical protein